MIRRFVLCFVALAGLFASPAFAQATYPTPAGSRVNGVAILLCNSAGANCAPPVGDANGQVSTPALSANFWRYAAATGGITNTTTPVTVKAAAGIGVRNYVLSMQCVTDTLGAATEIAVRDGASGTVMWLGKIQTTGWTQVQNINFNTPLRGTANTLVEIVTLTASVTGGVYCNLQGYTGS